MHLNDLKERIETDGCFEWIHPKMVGGIEPYKLKVYNENKWFRRSEIKDSDSYESEDEIITDYLYECLIERKMLIDNGEDIPEALNVNAIMLVKAGVYLICDLGSSYAGTHLAHWRELLSKGDVSDCLDVLISAHGVTPESFIRDILRDFILELFSFGTLWGYHENEGKHSALLSNEHNDFLRKIFSDGYSTIDKHNAKLFIDGSKR